MNSIVKLTYLTQSDIGSKKYQDLLISFYGMDYLNKWNARISWYFSLGSDSFRILVANIGDHFVGQACAYCVDAYVNQSVKKIFWGVDTFVLPNMRGKGIGKLLQLRLHKDLPNFTSAWYSPINGKIKVKCGCKNILNFPFAYYPVSSYFSILTELGVKKLISYSVELPRISLPYLYSYLNIPIKKWAKLFQVQELDVSNLPLLSSFIESCLMETQFHVIRSEKYLRWKYIENPRINPKILSVSKDGKIVGLVVFSDIFEGRVVLSKARVVKIYESIFTKDSGLSHKKLLFIISDFLHSQKKTFDGFLSLQKISYWPSLVYPRPSSKLLSTMTIDKLTSGYLTYSDQDME